MSLCLVSPAWRRFDVTALALAQRRWLCDELAARGVEAHGVIVADDANLDIARGYGFDTVEAPNGDLGRRFNLGFRHAVEAGADVVVHIGSDDWVHPDVFDVLADIDLNAAAAPDFPPVGGTTTWRPAPTVVVQSAGSIVDLERGRYHVFTGHAPQGFVPWLIPRLALEATGLAPIPERGYVRGMECLLHRGLLPTRVNWRTVEAQPWWCVDFKSDTNVTPLAALSNGLGDPLDAWDVLGAHYPAHLIDQARALTQEGVPTWPH